MSDTVHVHSWNLGGKVYDLINRVPGSKHVHTEGIINSPRMSPPLRALIYHICTPLKCQGKLLCLADANKTYLCVSRCNWGTACVRIEIFESTLAKSTNGYVIAEAGM